MTFDVSFLPFLPGSLEGADEVSLHPAHLVDSRGNATPAALIPFCGYQTNMTHMGLKDQGMPICTQFQPTQLNGQLCYSLNSSSMAGLVSRSGIDNSLIFFLDLSGIGLQADQTRKWQYRPGKKYHYNTLIMGGGSNELENPKIYLNTLTRFTEYKTGIFKLSSLKKISGTPGFMDLPDDIRKCESDTYENCRAKKYHKKVLQKCGCMPWFLNSVYKSKVNLQIVAISANSRLTLMRLCHQSWSGLKMTFGRTCIDAAQDSHLPQKSKAGTRLCSS